MFLDVITLYQKGPNFSNKGRKKDLIIKRKNEHIKCTYFPEYFR